MNHPGAPASAGVVLDAAARGLRTSEDDLAVLAPLSYEQAWLWYLDQLAPGQATYAVNHAWQIDGPFDLDALRQALQWLVARQAMLRLTIVTVDGEPMQRIAHHRDVELPVVDLTALPPQEREAEAWRLLREESGRPIDLARGPLYAPRVLRLDPTRHWLLTLRHHTGSGGLKDVLDREMCAAYNAFRSGRVPQLEPATVSYLDYVQWQREQLGGERLEALRRYWRTRLAGAPAALTLPTDRHPAEVRSGRGARVAFTLAPETVTALRSLARAEGATLHMTLLAAFLVLLSRYSGQDDVLVGVPVGGRLPLDFDKVVGMFVNTVVLRGELGADPSFRRLLLQTLHSATDAYEHSALPIGLVVQALTPERKPGRHALFQAMYSLQERYELAAPMKLDGATATPLETYNGTAKFDLSLLLVRGKTGIHGMFEYATDLFDAATIERMAAHFVTLVDAIAREPDRPVSTLPLLDPAERHRILVEWNATRSAYPADTPLHELFAAQTRRSPQAVALSDGERELDYATLDRRSTALARRLVDAGVAPRSRVGICIGRAIESVIAMLAVLKAGCAYVPLDRAHPAQRIAALLHDADVAAIVTVAATTPALAVWRTRPARPVLEVDRIDLDAEHAPFAPIPAGGGDLACVMYTSGSTGEPKGVAVPHRAIARLVLGSDYVRLRADDVVAHLANPAFDAAHFEIWGPLLNGARVALLATHTALAPAELAAALARHGVTTLFLTTALFNHVVREAPQALTGRQVLFGGEAADPRAVRACLAEARPKRLLHVYGPTEATTFATWHEVVAVAPDAQSVPIGRPLANTEAYVLDAHREPAPIDVPGELYLGGPGLALGYLDAPEATAERFVAHPFDRTPGARLYRTGDRARWRGDGTLEFLGRADRQVKIRGHRIEPLEIELALRRLPKVRDAVVKVHGTTSEDRRLAAYVVPAPGQELTPAELWRELRGALPDYLVPGAFVLLGALPLTPTGKVDLAVLPDPDDLAYRRKGFHVPPRNPLEAQLAAIWVPMLGVAKLGVRDDFFDLGGHSLLAAQMIARVERACGVSLSLSTLFAGATIEHLATVIRDTAALGRERVVTLNPEGTRAPLFFLHGDFTGGGFYTRNLSRALGADQPFYAVHPHGLDANELPVSIEAMADERLQAIRSIRPHGPYALGGHCAGAFVALEIARRLIDAGEDVSFVVVVDALAPGTLHPQGRAAPVTGTPPETRADECADVFVRYDRVLARYRPAPFRGRIAVLRSETTRAAEGRHGWDTLCADVQVHDIPGDHFTSITRHAGELGARMREVLSGASSRTAS